jgi:LPXTG-site transpeptidase (sortase) family protein
MAEEPVSLSIPSLDRVVTVLNPETRDIVELDRELLKGVVRHPDSALLGEEGNVVILGHSSYLPNVMNKNFQALNGVQKMKWGDIITLESDGTEYTYRVEKVYQAKASGVTIPTEVTGKRLTLVTCNSFGAKEDRFIVEAKLLSEKALTR